MKLDVEKYLPLIDELEMSRESKEEAIRLVWGIAESCVDQEFENHPIQHLYAQRRKTALRDGRSDIDSMKAKYKERFNNSSRSDLTS